MSRYNVIVTDDRFDSYTEEKQILLKVDASLKVYNFTTGHEFPPEVLNADALLANLCPIDGDVIKKLSRCRIISRYGVGYDNVDVKAATAAGIWVTNVPDYCKEEVSDHTLALLLNCIRKISYIHKRIREHGWNKHQELSISRIKGRILGLIGYGRIARAVHNKIKCFGFEKVLVYDPYIKTESILNQGAIPVSMEKLLETSDFISIHVPLTQETNGFIGEKELRLMKKQAILINTSRGPVVDEDALVKALEAGKLQSVGLDVFEQEPLNPQSPLLHLDNVVLTSHMAYYSIEALHELKIKAAENITSLFTRGRPIYPVNSI